MKNLLGATCVAFGVGATGFAMAGSAYAADLPTVEPVAVAEPTIWDVAFGVKGANEYILRSVSQTRGHMAIQGYAELSLFDWVYAGAWASNVDFGGNDPSTEADWYAGVRHTFDRLTLDVGYLDINYVGQKGGHDLDFWKIYGIAKYAVTDNITIGANVYWTSSYIGYNVDAGHASLFGKVAFPGLLPNPDLGLYVSGELGRNWVKEGFAPDYTFWNVGGGVTYKAATLDLRYTGANLSRTECALTIGQRSSCGDRFLVSLSFDTSLSKLK